MNSKEKTVGIFGGMGPEATVDLYDRIVKSTPAKEDKDHLRTIILSEPKTPDRTAGILGNGESPFAKIQAGLNTLVDMGAEVIAIPCVSSHYFFDKFEVPSHVLLLSILEETAVYTLKQWRDIKRVAVLGTDTTVQMNLFGKFFSSNGVTLIFPSHKDQTELVMDAIYRVKAGDHSLSRTKLKAAVDNLIRQGAEAVIAGCTEIPLALKPEDISIPLINTIQCLADAVVRETLPTESGKLRYAAGDSNF